MKANELRIGNWFFNLLLDDSITYHKVSSIYTANERQPILYDNNKRINQLTQCHPIPLTPEIVKKAGFKKNNDYYILKGRGDQTSFSIGWDGATLNIFDDGFEMSHGVLLLDGQSKYLHQLQNLYYSITGTELEINLNP